MEYFYIGGKNKKIKTKTTDKKKYKMIDGGGKKKRKISENIKHGVTYGDYENNYENNVNNYVKIPIKNKMSNNAANSLKIRLKEILEYLYNYDKLKNTGFGDHINKKIINHYLEEIKYVIDSENYIPEYDKIYLNNSLKEIINKRINILEIEKDKLDKFVSYLYHSSQKENKNNFAKLNKEEYNDLIDYLLSREKVTFLRKQDEEILNVLEEIEYIIRQSKSIDLNTKNKLITNLIEIINKKIDILKQKIDILHMFLNYHFPSNRKINMNNFMKNLNSSNNPKQTKSSQRSYLNVAKKHLLKN
jgi:hypothetical protein